MPEKLHVSLKDKDAVFKKAVDHIRTAPKDTIELSFSGNTFKDFGVNFLIHLLCAVPFKVKVLDLSFTDFVSTLFNQRDEPGLLSKLTYTLRTSLSSLDKVIFRRACFESNTTSQDKKDAWNLLLKTLPPQITNVNLADNDFRSMRENFLDVIDSSSNSLINLTHLDLSHNNLFLNPTGSFLVNLAKKLPKTLTELNMSLNELNDANNLYGFFNNLKKDSFRIDLSNHNLDLDSDFMIALQYLSDKVTVDFGKETLVTELNPNVIFNFIKSLPRFENIRLGTLASGFFLQGSVSDILLQFAAHHQSIGMILDCLESPDPNTTIHCKTNSMESLLHLFLKPTDFRPNPRHSVFFNKANAQHYNHNQLLTKLSCRLMYKNYAFLTLLSLGIDPNGTDAYLSTPLDHAIKSGDADFIRLLLCFGAKPKENQVTVINQIVRPSPIAPMTLSELRAMGLLPSLSTISPAVIPPTAAATSTHIQPIAHQAGPQPVAYPPPIPDTPTPIVEPIPNTIGPQPIAAPSQAIAHQAAPQPTAIMSYALPDIPPALITSQLPHTFHDNMLTNRVGRLNNQPKEKKISSWV